MVIPGEALSAEERQHGVPGYVLARADGRLVARETADHLINRALDALREASASRGGP